MNDSDRDKLLIQLETDMGWLKKGFANHLSHHWMMTLAAWAAAVSAIGALIASLLLK